MGGGALSSKNVSKLGSKEVRKNCYLERSERAQSDTVFSRFTSHFSRKRVAFTIAEVLITLGIIGVVAALTLPSVIINTIEKQRVAQLKKSYAELSQAFALAIDEYGTPDEWGLADMYDDNSHYILATNMKKYLKLSADCVDMPQAQAQTLCGQAYNSGKNWNNNSIAVVSNNRNGKLVILSNGTTVGFRVFDNKCNLQFGNIKNVCGELVVDTNGSKLPNQNGEDQFVLYVTKNKLVPAGISGAYYTFERACNKSIEVPYPSHSPASMYACAAWVLYNENQDYLHCNDLSWTGKTKCKSK